MSEAQAELREALAKNAGSDQVVVPRTTLEAAFPSPSQSVVDRLYLYVLVPGLLVLAGLALLGMFFLTVDGNDKTAPDLLLTAFTATMTGLLGLFAKSPGS